MRCISRFSRFRLGRSPACRLRSLMRPPPDLRIGLLKPAPLGRRSLEYLRPSRSSSARRRSLQKASPVLSCVGRGGQRPAPRSRRYRCPCRPPRDCGRSRSRRSPALPRPSPWPRPRRPQAGRDPRAQGLPPASRPARASLLGRSGEVPAVRPRARSAQRGCLAAGRVALVGHGGGAAAARDGRFARLANAVLGEKRDVPRHLAE